MMPDLPAPDVRPMIMVDVPAVAAIETRVHTHPWRASLFDDCLTAGNLALVAEAEGVIVGYTILARGGREAEVLNIAVDTAWQRRGVAELLLTELLTRVRPLADTVFLEVRASNHGAQALYEKLGFNQVGQRPAYYPAGNGREDALIYGLALES